MGKAAQHGGGYAGKFLANRGSRGDSLGLYRRGVEGVLGKDFLQPGLHLLHRRMGKYLVNILLCRPLPDHERVGNPLFQYGDH